MPHLLEDRVAVVTGGGGGIGGGVTRQFAHHGATLVVNDIDADLLDESVAEARAAGVRVEGVLGDIRDEMVVERVTQAAVKIADGRIDVLVNNVGDFRPNGRFLETEAADWNALYAINLEHVFRCTRAIVPSMVTRNAGSVINVSTVEALRGIPRNAVYSAFNAGVNAFTRSLAVELGGHGIRVNAIAPDLADTLQTPAAMMLGDRDPALIRSWVPLGRFGQPSEYADVAVFLASDLSRFVTGVVIPVDGGTTAASGWYGRANGKGWTNLPDAP